MDEEFRRNLADLLIAIENRLRSLESQVKVIQVCLEAVNPELSAKLVRLLAAEHTQEMPGRQPDPDELRRRFGLIKKEES